MVAKDFEIAPKTEEKSALDEYINKISTYEKLPTVVG